MTYDPPILAVGPVAPSVGLRDALRNAIRNHPAGQSVLKGRSASALRMDELRAGCLALGFDPSGIIALTQTAQTAQTAQAAPTQTQEPAPMPNDTLGFDTIEAPEDNDDTATTQDAAIAEDLAIEAEVSSIRRTIMDGGFGGLDARLRDLVRDARKPPVTVTVEVEVPMPMDGNGTSGAAPVVRQASPTKNTVAWSKAFGVKGALGRQVSHLWDGAHPETPEVNARYRWPAETAIALTQLARGENVMIFGPAGCGKTEFVQQIAAQLRRPFALISCDASTDAATLVGMTVPSADGGVAFQPGQLTRAISTPGCVVCLDEPSIARPGALFALQNVLTRNRALYIQETGQRVKVAAGVLFFATDNTSGHGGGARRGYHGTQPLNGATLDRFGVRIEFGWHDEATEAAILRSYVPGCTEKLATLLVSAASVTRAAAATQQITAGLGLRRLFAWAALLADGIDPDMAFTAAVLNCTPDNEREALRQQCLMAVDKNTVRIALLPDGAPAPSAASLDFDPVDQA